MATNMRLPNPAAFPNMSRTEFIEAITALFEAAPPLADHLYARRDTFKSYAQLIDEAERVVLREFPGDVQRLVIDAHPRLGAQKQTLSAQSYQEQGYAKQPSAADAEVNQELMRLNEQYEQKFGFKFVLFVNGRPRKDIIPIMQRHIETGDAQSELARGLQDMILIARDRLKKAQISSNS